MHPRNIFNSSSENFQGVVNFIKLSEEFPELKPFLKVKSANEKQNLGQSSPKPSKGMINFKDPNAVRLYNVILLKKYFGLALNLLPGALCPAVPNRLNYILWIEDVLNFLPKTSGSTEPENGFHGLDIGTGSSCIYPMLICQTRPTWKMAGSEINLKSFEVAQKNILDNNLGERIRLFLAKDNKEIPVVGKAEDGVIFQPHYFGSVKGLKDEDVASKYQYDFTMCNPPFYENFAEISKSRQIKSSGPMGGGHEGVSSELFTTGGELLFLKQMVKESFLYKDNVGWFTSMTGKKSTALEILQLLKQRDVKFVVSSELVQGRTLRWVVGWTFHKYLFDSKHPSCCTLELSEDNPDQEHTQPSKRVCLKKITIPTKEHVPTKQMISLSQSKDVVWISFQKHLRDLELEIIEEFPISDLTCKVVYPTWTRAWRRGGKEKSKEIPFTFFAQLTEVPELSLALHLTTSDSNAPTDDALYSFQSLCNHLRTFLQKI